MGTVFAKEGDLTSEVYLAKVRKMACAFCGTEPAGVAHHWPTKGSSGVTRDDLTIPVCSTCHQRCHGTTVVSGERRALPINGSMQVAAVAHTLRIFVETASPKEWEQFSRDRARWGERRWMQEAP